MSRHCTSEGVEGGTQQLPRPLESRQPEARILRDQPVVNVSDWPVTPLRWVLTLDPGLVCEVIGPGGLDATLIMRGETLGS